MLCVSVNLIMWTGGQNVPSGMIGIWGGRGWGPVVRAADRRVV